MVIDMVIFTLGLMLTAIGVALSIVAKSPRKKALGNVFMTLGTTAVFGIIGQAVSEGKIPSLYIGLAFGAIFGIFVWFFGALDDKEMQEASKSSE